jgi:hypothetical protein
MVGFFEERAVAFLDILGFKPLIERAEASAVGFQELLDIKTVLDSHVRFDNATLSPDLPEQVRPRYIFISDSVIVSAPLRHGYKNIADGLAIVVVKTIQIAQRMMELGHLIRGGISVGNAWHVNQNIFGSGYIDAYQTEQKAVQPRVVLSKRAVEIWREPGRWEHPLCIANDGTLIVDVLHTFYLRETEAGIPYEPWFQTFRAHVQVKMEAMPLGSPERSKWDWMAGFFNEALVRQSIGIGVQPFTSLSLPERD